jgi:hypothetical protein
LFESLEALLKVLDLSDLAAELQNRAASRHLRALTFGTIRELAQLIHGPAHNFSEPHYRLACGLSCKLLPAGGDLWIPQPSGRGAAADADKPRRAFHGRAVRKCREEHFELRLFPRVRPRI